MLRNETLKCKDSKAQAESKGKLHEMQREFYMNLILVVVDFLSYDLRSCIEFSKQSMVAFY